VLRHVATQLAVHTVSIYSYIRLPSRGVSVERMPHPKWNVVAAMHCRTRKASHHRLQTDRILDRRRRKMLCNMCATVFYIVHYIGNPWNKKCSIYLCVHVQWLSWYRGSYLWLVECCVIWDRWFLEAQEVIYVGKAANGVRGKCRCEMYVSPVHKILVYIERIGTVWYWNLDVSLKLSWAVAWCLRLGINV
jgi:hypothetical protein